MFHSISPESFQARVDVINKKIPSLTDQQVVFEFMQLLASVGNGYDFMVPGFSAKGTFSQLPMQFYWFSDGLDITRLTNAVLVCEPSGSRPNAISEAGWFNLPYSGLKGVVSSQFHQAGAAEDHRIWIAPHVPVSLSAQASRRFRLLFNL